MTDADQRIGWAGLGAMGAGALQIDCAVCLLFGGYNGGAAAAAAPEALNSIQLDAPAPLLQAWLPILPTS